jgi:hypothetical protein
MAFQVVESCTIFLNMLPTLTQIIGSSMLMTSSSAVQEVDTRACALSMEMEPGLKGAIIACLEVFEEAGDVVG